MTQLTIEYFDVKKAEQLVYFFMKKSTDMGMNVTKLRLIKWLYLAERESYKEFGEPLTGDRLGALRHGPAPSETLAIIEGKSRAFPAMLWSNTIRVDREHRHQYVKLGPTCAYRSIDELDRFSEAEIVLLEGIWGKYGRWSATRLERYLHDANNFPEWRWKEGDGTNWIDTEDILECVGFDRGDIESMVSHILAFKAVS